MQARRAAAAAEEAAAAELRKLAAQSQVIADELMRDRIRSANNRAAHEQWLNSRIYTNHEWEELTRVNGGKMPFENPSNGSFETPREEFHYVSFWGQAKGKEAPWENLRAAQMCLLYQGDGASPELAFAFLSNSNPDWPEVQLGLGLCYLRGLGVTQDTARGVALLELAAERGDTKENPPALVIRGWPSTGGYEAARELAISYDIGRFLPPDVLRAAHWYDRAGQHRLYVGEDAELKALKNAFWSTRQAEAVDLLRAEYAANIGVTEEDQMHGVENSLFEVLVALEDGEQLYQAGVFLDTRRPNGEPLIRGRNGLSYFFQAARLGNDSAARALFSPAENGYCIEFLDGWSHHEELAKFARENWSQLETRWQAAVVAGDAGASLPLALYYSGILGNKPSPELAERYLALVPMDLPVAQRSRVETAVRTIDARDVEEWVKTVWIALKANQETVNLAALAVTPDPAKAKALREEGNRLAVSDSISARDYWRDAAALGDLPAQVRLYVCLKSNGVWLSAYEDTLRTRLENAAAEGDLGAIATLSWLCDTYWNPRLVFRSASYADGQRWLAVALEHAAAKLRFQELADLPVTSDSDYANALAAARGETEVWLAIAATWGLEGQVVITKAALSEAEFAQLASRRQQILALGAAAKNIEQLLPAWENTIESNFFDPAADARFIQGYEEWFGYNETNQKDPVLALDYLTQSTQLGHPTAPLALAYFFGSGYAGFPRDPALAERLRVVADLRLTVLAAHGDSWAQTILGDLLVTGGNRRDDDPEHPRSFEWLPRDIGRGLDWLKIAALDGATLPSNFADATGQFVSRRIAWVYYNLDNKKENERWNLITDIIESVAYSDATPADWDAVLSEAHAILADTPETERLTELDQAIYESERAETEDDGLTLELYSARAEGRLALNWGNAASFDAEALTRIAPTVAASWQMLARIQESLRKTQNSEISAAIARTMAGDPDGPVAFERALGNASPFEVDGCIGRLAQCLYNHQDSLVLADLAERAEKFRPLE